MEARSKPKRIRNRDIFLLQRVYYLMQDIVSLEEKREWLRERRLNITQHLSDMPRGGGMPHGMDDALALIDETEERHRTKVIQWMDELKQAENIINGIESESMRTFVTMLYVDNIATTEVCERLNMSRRNFEKARCTVELARCMKDVRWNEQYVLLPEGK